jgi:hypothetical protein
MDMKQWKTAMLLCALSGFVGAGAARAADTLEPFDRGAFDLEYYFAYQGAGRAQIARSLGAELVLGYGITDRLSIYSGAGIGGDEQLSSGTGLAYFGAYGQLVDTDHLDLDLGLEFSAEGRSMSALVGTPIYLELNVDHAPDMSTFGAYSRLGVGLGGDVEVEGGDLVVDLQLEVGAYLTLAGRHQILLELVSQFPMYNADAELDPFVDTLALGYNVVISDKAEIISEVAMLMPDDEHPLGVAFLFGMIWTLPATG